MRKIIAKLTGKPLVAFKIDIGHVTRIARQYEDGVWYVNYCGIHIRLTDKGWSLRPVLNCESNGVFIKQEEQWPFSLLSRIT